MSDSFIKKIIVKNSRNVKDLEIPLSDKNRQHLILTGKNGSGKTSLLLEINKFLSQIKHGIFEHIDNQKKYLLNLNVQLDNQIQNTQTLSVERNIKDVLTWFDLFGGTELQFSDDPSSISEKWKSGIFLLAFFNSKRHINLNIPVGINKVVLKSKYDIDDHANVNFIQYIVNLKADRSFARDDNELVEVERIDNWFTKLENRLKLIFDVDKLQLRFDRKTYNFEIITDQNENFNFNNLSDGYSAIISIVTELLLRMEAHQAKNYDLEGIVIIDEIETHLHVDLQKKILPFLIDFFPKIQFIVTTHSPFVLSSLSNATICDLETKTITNDLSKYSYDALLESYFQIDKYSEELKNKVIEFENLVLLNNKNSDQIIKLKELRNYFAHVPQFMSNELIVKLQQIELNDLLNK